MQPSPKANVDRDVVAGFGEEWSRYDQSQLPVDERAELFDEYFAVFPWERLPASAVGFDAGCGSGRWALMVAPRVGHLHCVEPSAAMDVAQRALAGQTNCSFHRVTIDEMPFGDESMDFGYSLGVLHHIPDTAAAMATCVRKLKRGSPFLVYLYYAFDNRPLWFRLLWRASDIGRRVICRLPYRAKVVVTETLALLVYLPLARIAGLAERMGLSVASFPLGFYRDKSFYSMRTDAFDRFATSLEQRFSQPQIQRMMESAGLRDVRFSAHAPFWCAVGVRS